MKECKSCEFARLNLCLHPGNTFESFVASNVDGWIPIWCPINQGKENRRMKPTLRRNLANLYRAIGVDVPRHLLPDLESNEWRRYELEKEIGEEEYQNLLHNQTARETRAGELITTGRTP